MRKIILIMLTAYFLNGCAHVISQELREKADRKVTPEILFHDPAAYKGKLVILGGNIVGARNTEEGTYVEVLQKPLDYRGRPQETDISCGRFIIFHEKYLDAAIYSSGKEITAAGTVVGITVRPLDEIQYPYLLIKAHELHLFDPRDYFPIGFSIGIFSSF
jgi:outer membrane lipoprotein